MIKRKICVVTGTRADYGLFYWLLKEIQADKELELQIIATGMHLSPEFGLTYRIIEQDGFSINEKVDMLLSSDTTVAVTKSMGLAMIGFADALERLKPDIVVILGDRTEAMSAAQSAMVARIPIAHLHGGEVTEGAIDEAMRHSITKMAHLHFVAAEPYRKRVIQLGEDSERVFQYGSLGIENIRRLHLLNRTELETALDLSFGAVNFLVTYHPVTLLQGDSVQAMSNILSALDTFSQAQIIFTKPNSDSEGRILIEMIEQYANRNPNRVKVFTSLGQINYLSAIQQCDVVIGNSSSGLIEVPAFKKPTVNIGQRQGGRLKAASVIDCETTRDSIVFAIQQALSEPFKQTLDNVESPYEEGMTSVRIKEKLKHVDLTHILQKKFNDLYS
jgi:GDP/UDP-N,N'-diacetylbacillosamine 2-epimerase (hydrolysing)